MQIESAMTMSNKSLGNSFETAFCKKLFDAGYWVHNMAQNASGQPADVIAVKGKKAYLIDCKVCSKDRFDLSRIEPNQDASMLLWRMCGNGEGWFAIRIKAKTYMIPHRMMQIFKSSQATMSFHDIDMYGWRLEDWLNMRGGE